MANYFTDPNTKLLSQYNSAMVNEQSYFINNLYDYSRHQLQNNKMAKNNAQKNNSHRRRRWNITEYGDAAAEELNVKRRNQENIIRSQSNNKENIDAQNIAYQNQYIIQRETNKINCVNVSAMEQLAAYARRAQINHNDNITQVIDNNSSNVNRSSHENNSGAIGGNQPKYQPTFYDIQESIDKIYFNDELDR